MLAPALKTLTFLGASVALHGALALGAATGLFGSGRPPPPPRSQVVELEIVSLPPPAPPPLAEPVPEPLPVVQARRAAPPRVRPAAPPPTLAEAPPPPSLSSPESPPDDAEPPPPAAGPELATAEGGGIVVPGGGTVGGIGAVAAIGALGALGPPPAAGPSAEELAAQAESRYLAQLNARLRQDFVYPRRARRAGLTGRVVVEVELDGRGALVHVAVARSSGHEVLDTAAVQLVRGLGRLPPPPEHLRHRRKPIHIPLDYGFTG